MQFKNLKRIHDITHVSSSVIVEMSVIVDINESVEVKDKSLVMVAVVISYFTDQADTRYQNMLSYRCVDIRCACDVEILGELFANQPCSRPSKNSVLPS